MKDFAGCETVDVLSAIGLSLVDLFPAKTKSEKGHRSRGDGFNRVLATAPTHVVKDSLTREIARRQALEADRLGYEPPVTSRTINAARATIARKFGRTLNPIAPFVWERCGAHAEDPLWPVLFERALVEATRDRWHFIFPEAEVGATDPLGPNEYDFIRAEDRAAAQLRRIARDQARAT